MSLAKQDPKNALSNEIPRYSWQEEETLVERRRRLPYRIRRFVSRWWFWALVAAFTAVVLTNAQVAAAVAAPLALLPFIFFRLCLTGSMMAMQLLLMFWFLARTRMYTIWPGQEGVSFADYRGQPELLDQAKQIVKLLRGVRVFEEAGGEPLNGLLLEGPPGTGKTWLAQAISTEAGVPFFFVDASSLQAAFVGIAPLKVAGVYRKARKAAKEYGAAVIFMDEIDSVGSRGNVSRVRQDTPLSSLRSRLPIFMGMGGGSGVLTTLLIEMSGFSLEHGWRARLKTWWYKTIFRRKPPKPQKRVLTIGATNMIGALDPALLRPGRFDKKIHVDAPDMEGRRDIIAYYLSKMAHDETMDPIILASETPNYTPADIKYLLNEALRYALFDNRTFVTYKDWRHAQPEHEMGLRMPIKNLSKEDKYRLAAHEAGHAVAIRLFRPNLRIARITIIRQGGAHGHVSYYPATEEFDYVSTYEQMMNDLRVSVGGKAGEMEWVGEGSQSLGVGVAASGASDFGRIRSQLRRMASAGMFGMMGANMNGAGNLPPEIREEMEATFQMVLDEVRTSFRLHEEMGKALIEVLVNKDEMLADEVEAFFNKYGFYTPRVELKRGGEEVIVPVASKTDEGTQAS